MEIAGRDEVLKYLTDTMRMVDEDTNPNNAFKAAELLGKHYGLFKGNVENECGDVIIVDNIGTDKNDKA